jgi:hypothetical protein
MYVTLMVLLDLTFREIVSDIPHDSGAFIAYALLALFAAAIIYGSRGRSSEPAGTRDEAR